MRLNIDILYLISNYLYDLDHINFCEIFNLKYKVKNINWHNVTTNITDFKLIQKLEPYLDINHIILHKDIPNEFIFRNYDHVCINCLLSSKILNEEFIRNIINNFKDVISIINIFKKQKLSLEFINEFKYLLDIKFNFINTNSEFIYFDKEIIHYSKEYFNIEEWDSNKLKYLLNKKVDIKFIELVYKKLTDLEWEIISSYRNLSESFILKYFNSLNWDLIFIYQHINESFIRKNINKLDWTLITKHADISSYFIIEFQDYINWNIIHKRNDLSEYIIIKYINKIDIRYLNQRIYSTLSEDFLNHCDINKINWKKFSKGKQFSINFLKKYKNYIHWDLISYKKFNDSMIIEFEEYIEWNILSSTKLSESIITKYKDKLDWDIILVSQSLSIEFMDTHSSYLNWNYVSLKQEMDIGFIRKYHDKINWINLLTFQVVSEDILIEFEHIIDWNYVSYQDLSIEFIDRYAHKLNFSLLSLNNIDCENFFRKYKDRIDWFKVSFKTLSESFIREFKDKLMWQYIFQNHTFSSLDIVKEFRTYSKNMFRPHLKN